MKVLVLEDDYQLVLKGAFDYVSTRYFNNELIVLDFSKSQDVGAIEEIKTFDKIFVDISLHRNSEKDGYAFIKSLKDALIDLKKVVIITGSDNVEAKLQEFGLPKIKVLTKPVTFIDLKDALTTI